MKIRDGFVSNSSSSSFILSFNKDADMSEIKINMSIENCITDKIKTIDEAKQFIKRQYLIEDENSSFSSLMLEEGEYVQDLFKKICEALEDNKVVIIGDASSESYNPAEIAIYYGALSSLDDPNIEVIESGEC